MLKMPKIQEAEIKGKIVLVRADLNVPIVNGKVDGDLRIRAIVPTLTYLRENGAKRIVLISHLGRPEVAVDGKVPSGVRKEFSLKPVTEVLKNLFGVVEFLDDLNEALAKLSKMPEGGVLLLENLRFDPREKANDGTLIQEIVEATGAEIYVQDAFAALHRAHASTAAVKKILPVYAGLLVEKEVENLDKVMENPERPLTMIIGGAKVVDKEPLVEAFLDRADKILVGGKIAADGFKILDEAGDMDDADAKIYVAKDFDENLNGEKLDIGPLATAKFADVIVDSKTVVWNGLLGMAEDPAYATASTIIAELLGEKRDGTTVICGGDTTAFVEELMTEHEDLEYSLISTGGGATLEYLAGKELPGL